MTAKKGRISEMQSAFMLWKLQKSRDRRINIKTFEFLFDNKVCSASKSDSINILLNLYLM